jgi:predicted dehydrogenase
LRFGLIGCGHIGQLRAAALAQAGPLPLVAVSDASSEAAAALTGRRRADIEKDWPGLLRRADVEAVIVSTPPSSHAEICIAALEAGKHVLCEKPLAISASECHAIVEAAGRSGRLLATGFNYRFYPSIRKARAILDRGLIGELDHIRAYSGYSATDGTTPWLYEAAVTGGGTLRDNGIHLIDLCRYFLGEVAEVEGFASNAVWRRDGCEDNGFGLLRSPDEKVAQLQASWTEWRGYRFLIEIYGTRGCVRSWCFPMLTQLVYSQRPGGPTRRRMHLFPRTNIQERLRSYRWVVVRSFVQELQAFGMAVHGHPTPVATGNDGLRAVEIAEAIAATSGGVRPQPISA